MKLCWREKDETNISKDGKVIFENIERIMDKKTFELFIVINEIMIPLTCLVDLPLFVDREEYEQIITTEFGEELCNIICAEVF